MTNYKAIIDRCREAPPITPIADRRDAADAIEKLLSENAKLREALLPLVKARWGHDEDGWLLLKGVSHDELDHARAVLGMA